MTFQIHALDPAQFAPLFALSDAELAALHMVRNTCATTPGSPCRVSLADAAVGDTLLLLGHEHLSVASPYRSSHAIFVREGAVQMRPAPGEVPPMIAQRLISARAFDASGMMTAADVLEGSAVAVMLQNWIAEPGIAHVDLHTARQGCFLARAFRASRAEVSGCANSDRL
jgi:hypothetical protein